MKPLQFPIPILLFQASCRIRYIICWTQCKMRMWSSLFKNYVEFQDGNGKALNQAWGPSQRGALLDHTAWTHLKLALTPDLCSFSSEFFFSWSLVNPSNYFSGSTSSMTLSLTNFNPSGLPALCTPSYPAQTTRAASLPVRICFTFPYY